MTLAFKTKINSIPTYFQEKIIECLLRDRSVETHELSWAKYLINTKLGLYVIGSKKQKFHTIREDKANRWKAGNDIHFIINNRTPNRFQFAPVVKCVSTQKIEIKYYVKNNANKVSITIEGKEINLNDLAINDGFKSAGQFLDYFNKDFTGKIIHWTDLKY